MRLMASMAGALQFPSRKSRTPVTRTAQRMPAMKMIPPMVGVPSLLMCHTGPSRLMLCPAFSRLSRGMQTLPARTVTTREIRKACRYLIGHDLS